MNPNLNSLKGEYIGDSRRFRVQGLNSLKGSYLADYIGKCYWGH